MPLWLDCLGMALRSVTSKMLAVRETSNAYSSEVVESREGEKSRLPGNPRSLHEGAMPRS